MNWIRELSSSCNCKYDICLGDFFDQANLTSEEITALNDIDWGDNEHIFIVGNHEMGINNLSKSSSHIFNLIKNCIVIDQPKSLVIDQIQFDFLPYILEVNRNKLDTYFEKINGVKSRVLLSHNDIKGLQLGRYISKDGFEITEIESIYDLCINGHLHNGCRVSEKIYNIGNLVGQNFSEDAYKFEHCVFIINTDTLHIEIYENPYSFNFYKLDTSENINLNLKNNAVCTVKCKQCELDNLKDYFNNLNNVCEVRFIVQPEVNAEKENIKESFSVDHLKSFKSYILDTIGSNDIIISELEEICKCS